MDQSIHNSSQRGTAVYYTPAASGDHGPGSAPNCTQCIQYTVPGNHHTLDKHKHVRRTCQQRHPKNIFSYINQIDRGNYMVTQCLRNKISLWVWKNILQVNAANNWNVFCLRKAHGINYIQ